MHRLKLCGACKSVRYCGKECQTAHWKDHKAECRVASIASYSALFATVFPPSRPDFRGDIGGRHSQTTFREEYERKLVDGSSYERILAAWARLDIDHPDYQIRPVP